MNKFLTYFLHAVESIELTIDNVINLIFQPLYCIARILVDVCNVWGIDLEENENEQPEGNNERKIGFIK